MSPPLRERWNRAGHRLRLADEWRDLLDHRDLLWSLVQRDLTIRYKRSSLGFFWTMLHPLILMVIFTIIFSAIFRFQIPHYPIYFLSQYIGWMYFSQTTIDSMKNITWNGELMKRVRVPKSIFTVASTLSGLINMVLALLPLFAIMLFLGTPIRLTILFLPVSFVILAAFTLGASLALSALSVFFVDVREMYQAFVPAILYLTPIIYPLSIVPEKFLWMIRLNPLVYLLQLLRAPLYYGILPTGLTVLVAAAVAAGGLVIGWLIFRDLSTRFYPHL